MRPRGPPTARRPSLWRRKIGKWRRSSVAMRSNELTLLVIVCCLAVGCRSHRCVDGDASRRAIQATWANDVRTMRDLLASDASIATAPGCTGAGRPLHFSASMRHGNLVRLMLEHGASVDASGTHGETPLISATDGRPT